MVAFLQLFLSGEMSKTFGRFPFSLCIWFFLQMFVGIQQHNYLLVFNNNYVKAIKLGGSLTKEMKDCLLSGIVTPFCCFKYH